MYSVVSTAAIRAMEARFICVEADVSDGMPYFEMVGFLSSEVKEAKERVRTALRNSGFALPPKRIMVNLSPVNLRKVGNIYDLPVTVAILHALEIIKADDLNDFIVIGEVGLDGSVHRADGVLPIVCAARTEGYRYCLLPKENEKEASCVEGIGIVGVSKVTEAVEYLNLKKDLRTGWHNERKGDKYLSYVNQPPRNVNTSKSRDDMEVPEILPLDFCQIHGQETVKRACEVAVAGMHNFLMIGPPGSGKTMIASRIPGILPIPTFEERMEISKIYSIAGALKPEEGLVRERPFRSPHHTVSVQGMVGGGQIPKPGEITLSHGGVLFLDELPEFAKSVLETLRQPLEEGVVSIVRASGRYDYPADFLLVCAMNPCACGYYPDRNRCNCSVNQVSHYLGKISRPLLDRIDISVEAPRVGYEELGQTKEHSETSAQIRERIIRAHKIQNERYRGQNIHFNSQLSGAQSEKYCELTAKQKRYMGTVFEKMNLTARGYYKILKVARTIADLKGNNRIETEDLVEAIMYKGIDEKFFGEVVR